MTKLLLRLFAPGDPTDSKTRAKTGKLSGFVGIVCNVLLSMLKLVAGALSGSVSITADAMNNLSDATSSVVTLIGFKLAEKPADEDHPYGHARYEYLSGLAVAAMIIVIGFELGKTSVEKILQPAAVSFSLAALLVLLGSVAVKLWLCLFNRTLGKRIDSAALLATAADSRNDVIATLAVLAAMRKKWGPYRLGKHSAYLWAAVLSLTAPMAIGALAALDFDRAFVIFHSIFFPGKTNWVFDWYADPIIRVLPQVFFRNCAILIGMGLVAMAVGILVWGGKRKK